MKRGISTLTSILASMAVLVSCGTLRHAAPDPVSKQELDSYAHDHFFMEGIKMYNEEQYDAAMDLMAHSLEYDTASAGYCLRNTAARQRLSCNVPCAWNPTTTGTAVCWP